MSVNFFEGVFLGYYPKLNCHPQVPLFWQLDYFFGGYRPLFLKNLSYIEKSNIFCSYRSHCR